MVVVVEVVKEWEKKTREKKWYKKRRKVNSPPRKSACLCVILCELYIYMYVMCVFLSLCVCEGS